MYYKYLPIERITYLDDGLLRFTQPGDLNDPFECLPQKPNKEETKNLVALAARYLLDSGEAKQIGEEKFFGVISEQLKKIDDENGGSILESFYSSVRTNTNKKIGILSLSKNWNSTLMWSHYTNSHRGFCIGFERNDTFFKEYSLSSERKIIITQEVKYSTDRVRIPMNPKEPKLSIEPFINKSVDWQYEEEIRVIGSLNLASKVIENGNFPINLFEVPHSAIGEIILGVNILEEPAKKIIDFCTKNKIKCFQSKISNIKFDMERDEKYCL